ncbi:MAG: AAA family ATPase [Candidatus Cloacimonadaceae bacterium]|nr:AAA family ATPase [Candidatus Cloacimonadaceae bacterium]
MYLSRLYIRNYRSIKELDLRFEKGKNVIIGRNNAGKSNIIKALNIVLSETAPAWDKVENVTEGDFYYDKSKDSVADELLIFCILIRETVHDSEWNDDKLEDLDYASINKCFGFNICGEIIRWEEKKPIKEPIRYRLDPSNLLNIFDNIEDDCSGKIWVDSKLNNQKRFEEVFKETSNFAYLFKAKRNESGKINKDIRFLFREDSSHDWVMGYKAQVRNELMQSAIIPSFRDPQNQLRLTSYTWFGKLMKHLLENKITPQMNKALERVQLVANKIFAGVTTEIKNTSLDIAFPGTQLQIRFSADSKTDLYKSCQLFVDDGINTPLTDKGSGIQSAAVIGLFNYYTKNVNTASAALLCVEEPEIYLHPHARRVISDRLDDFLDNYRNQVIITTHCSEFIRTTTKDLNIIMVHKDNHTTEAVPIQISQYKRLLLDNNQNELFFAEKVIVCEGNDGYLLRMVADQVYPGELDKQNVSIIAVGGKDNIKAMVELVLKTKTRCYIISDFDFMLRDLSGDHKKYLKINPELRTHSSIASVQDQFFEQSCTFQEKGKTVKKLIVDIRNWIKTNREETFFTAKRSRQIRGIPSQYSLSKNLSYLQRHGLCILSGEIEDLFIDQSALSSKKTKGNSFRKLDLEAIYRINSMLDSKSIEQIIDVVPLKRFLKAVLKK